MGDPEQPGVSSTSEGRFELLVSAITDYAIYMLDPTGIVTSWNAGAQRFKGYEAPEIIGQHFSRFYTEGDREAGLPKHVLETAATEGRYENEGWRVRKDGTRFWAHVIVDAIRDPAGRLVGFAKITRDLTERKFAADALKRSEEQFRLLVNGVTDYALYMLDPQGRITSWNSGAERIKGYRADEIVGEHFSRFYAAEDRARGEPQRGLDIAIREGRFEKAGWRVRKDGTRFWANIVIDAIRDEAGELIGFAKITRDITERKEAERSLEQAREALFQSQKMEAVGQLTGGIAHDFNNLLTAVLGSLELLRKRVPDDPKVLRLLDNAMQGAQRGASLTQRMLAFARRQALKTEPVDVPALVRGMSELLQHSLGSSVRIETRFPLVLNMVCADENQLELALLNLAVNARDAMPDGGTIIIAARQESITTGHATRLPPGHYVCLSITDTGEGMDEPTLARAMEPFFTTKGIGKGTGLGLSMVHGVTEQSGGRFVLKSRKGEGTTAELWLPVAEVEGEQGADDKPAAESPHAVRPLVVLAVDDDNLVLLNTAALVEELGHTVLEASSAREALALLQHEKHVDLVITDQIMPQTTGLQLAERIRAEWPNLPIILATGFAELPADADPTLHRLDKPFGQKELAQAITAAMEAEQARGRVLKFRSR
ncbi:MAG TPA: PAS domain S-box protein [Beijerinckiaceae bacterium]|nr:PAS domain S-box protein [Beijerinckiaceae bacterium]